MSNSPLRVNLLHQFHLILVIINELTKYQFLFGFLHYFLFNECVKTLFIQIAPTGRNAEHKIFCVKKFIVLVRKILLKYFNPILANFLFFLFN